MATTVDDLIGLKDEAVAACHGIVAAWENRDLAVIDAAANNCQDVVERAELYDAADEDDTVCSIEEYEEKRPEQMHAKIEPVEGGLYAATLEGRWVGRYGTVEAAREGIAQAMRGWFGFMPAPPEGTTVEIEEYEGKVTS